MQTAERQYSLGAVGADALFASALQSAARPSAGQVRRAVLAALRGLGAQGCRERVAQEFGDHPDAAVTRMRWALQAATDAFTPQPAPPAARPAAGRALPQTGQAA